MSELHGLSGVLHRLADARLPDPAMFALAQVGLIAVVAIDWATGAELSPVLLYLVPVVVVVWTTSTAWGVAMAVVVTAAEAVVRQLEHPETTTAVTLVNTGEQLVFYLLIAWLIGAQRQLFDRQRHLATTDPLTSALNRAALDDEGGRLLERERRGGRPVACLYFDLDGLKEVNDRDGHEAGDRLISRFAAVIEAELRAGDLFARLGGDEFAALLPESDRQQASATAQRLLDALAAAPGEPPLAASVGVAVAEPGTRRLAELLRAADHAMYEAKRAGGRRLHLVELGARSGPG